MNDKTFDRIDISLQVKMETKKEIEANGKEYARWLRGRMEDIVSDYWLDWPYAIRMIAAYFHRKARKKKKEYTRKYKTIAQYVDECIKEDPANIVVMRINGEPEIHIFSMLRSEDFAKIDVLEIEYHKMPNVFFFVPDYIDGRLHIKLFNWS